VEARAEIIFDAEAQVTGIRQTWVFDPAYSAYAIMGLNVDRDGRPDQANLTELADASLASLAEANYFTAVKVNGSKASLAAPSDPQASVADDRLVLKFVLPLQSPTKPRELTLDVGDPTFFTAFTLPQAADSAMLSGAPEDCRASINQPAESKAEDIGRLAQDIAAALRGKPVASSPVDSDPAGRITVTCRQD